MKMTEREASGLKTDQRLSSLRSHDARHGRIRQQKDSPAEEPQFNVAVVQHGPFRVAVVHELSNMGHHARLRRIAVEAASDIVGRSDSSVGLRASRSGVSAEISPENLPFAGRSIPVKHYVLSSRRESTPSNRISTTRHDRRSTPIVALKFEDGVALRLCLQGAPEGKI